MSHRNDNQAQSASDPLGNAPLSHALRSEERRAAVDSLNERAAQIKRLDYLQLLALSEQAFELACQIDADGQQYAEGMAAALAHLAHRSSTIGEWTDALSQGAQSLALLGSDQPCSVRGEALGTIGWSHFCMGDYAEALEHMMEALRVAEEVEDLSLQAYMLDGIGSVHASSGHVEEGLEAQQRSLSLHRQLGDSMGEALVLNNMAYTQMDAGDVGAALDSACRALRFAEETDRPYLLVGVLDTVAEVHRRLGNLEQAEHFNARTLTLARVLQSEPDEATSMMALARIRCARQKWDQALEATERALELAERRSLSVEEFECHELLSDIHERRGDLGAALRHFRRFYELKQARVNEETQARLASLRVSTQVENAKKDAEIHRLRNLALEREVEERRVAQARLEARASLDPLTGLFNRGHLAVLAEDLGMAGRSSRPVSLLMFDVDRFKEVNDGYGHVAGDRVLTAITRELSENARQSDVACRYGGDEFLVLLDGMDSEGARVAAERLREIVSATPISFGLSKIHITISVGVATAHTGGPVSLDSLIERADRALYAAKQGGRDRVEVASASPRPHVAA
ncbi:MAG TPA: diguanylate cyclase [Coriobacteriia bacterium]|nr:diguanylate cyclase [Coriobacteriia bacterium]